MTGHKSSKMAEYYAKHAEQVVLHKQVVEQWNEALAERAASALLRGGGHYEGE